MTTTYRANTNLGKPALNDASWNDVLDANFDALDAGSPLGRLAVSTVEVPSTSLNVKVSAGTFRKSDGTFVAYAGTASQAVTPSATNYLYLTDAGVLTLNTTGFPATPHVRLAVVVAGASTLTSVTDARVAYHAAGATVSLALTGGAFNDAGGVVVVHTGTASGTQIGGVAAEKLGFWGATPVVQPSGASQAAAAALTSSTITVSTGGTASTTLAAATNISAQTNSTTGTASTTIPDVGASFSQATLNNIHASFLARWGEQLSLNTNAINSVTSLGTQVNALRVDLAAVRTLVNAIQAALVAAGVMKGSA